VVVLVQDGAEEGEALLEQRPAGTVAHRDARDDGGEGSEIAAERPMHQVHPGDVDGPVGGRCLAGQQELRDPNGGGGHGPPRFDGAAL
jgi:hypothetical protein